jgi:hypothetical protein
VNIPHCSGYENHLQSALNFKKEELIISFLYIRIIREVLFPKHHSIESICNSITFLLFFGKSGMNTILFARLLFIDANCYIMPDGSLDF